MRKIRRTTRFQRDFKREKKGAHRLTVEADLVAILAFLAMDRPLPDKHRDHPLGGQWKTYRDVHLRPDLILIYRYLDLETVELVRLGSHSELGL